MTTLMTVLKSTLAASVLIAAGAAGTAFASENHAGPRETMHRIETESHETRIARDDDRYEKGYAYERDEKEDKEDRDHRTERADDLGERTDSHETRLTQDEDRYEKRDAYEGEEKEDKEDRDDRADKDDDLGERKEGQHH